MADEKGVTSEYEREAVPERAWLGLKSYVGQFAGEHVAAPACGGAGDDAQEIGRAGEKKHWAP